jgi:hypothetical protein
MKNERTLSYNLSQQLTEDELQQVTAGSNNKSTAIATFSAPSDFDVSIDS